MTEGEQPNTPQGETENHIEKWEYQSRFLPYLVQIAEQKRTGVESLDQFPERIELSQDWHEAHEKMRMETQDGHERWTPIGFRRGLKDILVPKKYLVGRKHDVPPETFYEGLEKDLINMGITRMVGDIHSHPGWGKKFVDRFLKTGRVITEYRGFSPGDMFRLVDPEGIDFLIFGVVDSKANYYAFVTKETQRLTADSKLSSSKDFQNYWFYDYTSTRFHKNIPITYPKVFSLWDVNLGTARQYNIALYKGNPGEDLVRSYP